MVRVVLADFQKLKQVAACRIQKDLLATKMAANKFGRPALLAEAEHYCPELVDPIPEGRQMPGFVKKIHLKVFIATAFHANPLLSKR